VSLQSVDHKMSGFPSDNDCQGKIVYAENGLPEVIISHEYRYGLETTAFDIIRKFSANNGYKNGKGWEYPEDEYFQQVLLGLANKALLAGDINKLDAYLGLEYWNVFYMGKLLDKINVAKRKNDQYTVRTCTQLTRFSNTMFRSKALCFVIWHKHIPLFEYILSKINPCNISDDDFEFARMNGLGEYIVKKDPSRYYMRRYYHETDHEYYMEVPEIRTQRQREIYLLMRDLETKYEVLAIYNFSDLTKDNLLVRGMPKDVLRQIIQMV
jgi:hypothetical protein